MSPDKSKNFQSNVIITSIGNLVHAEFTSEFFDIPLCADADRMDRDSYTTTELYDVLASLFGYVFLDVDVMQSFKHRVAASKYTEKLGKVMQKRIGHVTTHNSHLREYLIGSKSKQKLLPDYGTELVRRLSAGGKSAEEVTWTIIPTAAAACATQAQGVGSNNARVIFRNLAKYMQWAQLIDLYLSDKYYVHWPDIQRLARSNDAESFEKLKKYALEGYDTVPRSG